LYNKVSEVIEAFHRSWWNAWTRGIPNRLPSAVLSGAEKTVFQFLSLVTSICQLKKELQIAVTLFLFFIPGTVQSGDEPDFGCESW
jgi:hypothetical protein